MVKNTLVGHLGPWGEVQGTPKGTLPYSGAQSTNWTSTQPNNVNIICRESQVLIRLIRESIYVRVNNLKFNRNIGKFHLNHIWDRVLFSTPNLKVAISPGNAQLSP